MKNAIKKRVPKSAENLKQLEDKFIDGTEKLSLKDLTLDELANRYTDIDQQSQMLKGQILLEARERFPSDKEFGQWIIAVGLSDSSRYTRSTYMNLARFFKDRDMAGISITAAYEIAAPSNADIAVDVYEYARNKNLPVAEVKRQIAIRKGESLSLPTATDITPVTPKAATDISDNPVRIIPTSQPLIVTKPLDDDEIIENAVEIIEESIKTETAKIFPEKDDDIDEVKAKILADLENTPPLIAMKILNDLLGDYRFKFYGKR